MAPAGGVVFGGARGADFTPRFRDEAAALRFAPANGDAFVELKEALLKLLGP